MRSLAVAVFLVATAASATPQWNEGSWETTYELDVITNSLQPYADTYTGYYGDQNSPLVGDVFYGEVGIAIVGTSFAKGALARIEVTLPQKTTFAISNDNPVVCMMRDISTGAATQLPAAQCPQSFDATAATQAAYYYGGIWIPDHKWLEVYFPLRATTVLSGSAGNDSLSAAIKIISDSTDWVYPHEGVFVFPKPVELSYPTDAATGITSSSATLNATAANHYTAGTLSFDFGTTTDYELKSESTQLTADTDATPLTDLRAGLTPSTTYHWRVRFVDAAGVATVGADQTFRTADLPRYHVDVATPAGGFVELSPEQESYPQGATLTVTAHPDQGYDFAGWIRDGVDAGNQNPLTFTVTADTHLEPRFTVHPTSGGTPAAPVPGPSASVAPQTGGCTAGGAEAGATPLLLLLLSRRRRSARR